MTDISFFVAGKAEPQGSTRAFVVGGRARVTSDNPANAGWRNVVAWAMQQHIHELTDAPVELHVTFYLPAPKSLPKRRPVAPHTKKPDLDKLLRSIGDAGTGVIWKDDSAIVSTTASKQYAVDGQQPGAQIRVRVVE